VLNGYREKCLDVLGSLERFSINHVPREVNVRANMIAQQASVYDVKKGTFKIKGEPGYSDVMAIWGADDGTAHNSESEKTDWRDELKQMHQWAGESQRQEGSALGIEVCHYQWCVISPNLGWSVAEMFKWGRS
jgi:hypothetical protein